MNDGNVRQKQLATVEWCAKINGLPAIDRLERRWEYILLSENHFYGYSESGASLTEICELAKISEAGVKGISQDVNCLVLEKVYTEKV